jgi:hypothetical protein
MNYLSAIKRRGRSGQAMVEFAIISFVLVTILTGILGLGIMLLRGNMGVVATNSVSNLLDLEFDSSVIDISDAIDDNVQLTETLATTSRVPSGPTYYSETDLVLSPADYRQARDDFETSGRSLAIKSLLPLYEYDALRDVYHFPGTIVKRNSDSDLTVLVPLTSGRDSNNLQIISEWRRPVELNYLPPDTVSGTPAKATISINYPASSGVLIAYRNTGEFTDNGDPVRSPISSEVSPESVSLGSVFNADYDIETAGEYGVDSAYAYLSEVRVYQRVFTQSSTFRFR